MIGPKVELIDLVLQEEIEGWFKKFGGMTYITMKEKKDKNW